MSINYGDMKPGDRKFIRQERIILVEAYKQRDDPPGRSPVGFHYTTVAEAEQECGPNISQVVARVVKSA